MLKKRGRIALWALPVRELLSHLDTSINGLSHEEAKKRFSEHGPNEILYGGTRQGLSILLSQFKNSLILLLIAASIISFFMHEKIDGIVILAIVLLNAILGFMQEYKAENAIRELRQYISLKAKTLRDGKIIEVDARELVPGDIVHLNIGDIIPADIRLIHVEEMSTDESSLTGESLPVIKKVSTVSAERSLPQYLCNIAFMGSSVATGLGYGVVISTGKDTLFGKTAAYLKQKPPETDFQINMKKFSNFLLKVTLGMTAFIFFANAVLGKGIFPSFIFALALAVGIAPEALPIIITMALSRGALKMSKEKVIIKRLQSVEDLGNIDTLCCDKTGTLTEGKLSLHEYVDLNGKKDNAILLYGILCSTTEGNNSSSVFSSPIDRAIHEKAIHEKAHHALSSIASSYTIIDENEFDFDRRRMSIVARKGNRNTLIAKGAPESILAACTTAKYANKKVKLDRKLHDAITSKFEKYENEGYRVIAIAEKHVAKSETKRSDEKEMNLLGFMLFIDPPKKGVRESLAMYQHLGVGVKVISGDSPRVTLNICKQVGIYMVEDRAITGDDLEKLDEAQFELTCEHYNVFARITPEQKYKIVSALKKEGHVLGFLGDGVNDAPALRVADVGISVDSAAGIAKDAADVVLLEKNLKILAHGIREGRKTFGNITKYILNTISANYGNMYTVAISSLFMKFIPLLPAQILLNNFLSDMPALAVSTDNVDDEFLKKPKKWNINLISKFMIYFGMLSVVFDLALILPMLFILKVNPDLFRTAWFVESCLSEVVILFAIRTKRHLFRSKPSKYLFFGSILTAMTAIGITYTAAGAKFFGFVHMPAQILVLIGIIVLFYLISAELMKRFLFPKFDI